MKRSTFLSAEWRKLAMANYAIDPALLKPHLPAGTELDNWQGACYVSLIGFMFLNTRIRGFAIPFHVNFEEVNLRFYVRHKENGIWKRGTVFLKEFVPRMAITLVANTLYGENYDTLPMAHSWRQEAESLEVEYRWKKKGWHHIRVSAAPFPVAMETGSEHEFITEHYWGFTRHGDLKTSQYEVEHPRWMCYPVKDYSIDVDFGAVYGAPFAFLSGEQPRSVLLAEGSEVTVRTGSKILL